jgi:hypothetical protein
MTVDILIESLLSPVLLFAFMSFRDFLYMFILLLLIFN